MILPPLALLVRAGNTAFLLLLFGENCPRRRRGFRLFWDGKGSKIDRKHIRNKKENG